MSYDGPDLVSEHANAAPYGVLRRYVHGPGIDDPIVWYEGSGTTDRRFLQADERGSVTAVTNSTGGVIATNSYDEYGVPASTNLGRFQYTGQTWLPGLGLYNYKARIYSPKLGRLLQPDPVGYDDGMNMYAYVGADPVNARDPDGLKPYQLYPTIQAAVDGIRADYFSLSVAQRREYGGQIFAVFSGGRTKYFYNIAQVGEAGRISPFYIYYTSSRYPGSRLVYEWHTHIIYPTMWMKPSPADRARANETQTPGVILYPGGQTPYKPTQSGGKSQKPGPVHEGFYLYTYEDWIIDNRAARFGPGGTAALIAYLINCVRGEVDLCTEPTGGVPVDPLEVPSDGSSE
jgi:RHS repeat-associated protein